MAWDVCDIDMDGEGDLESDRFTSMLHELFAVEDDPEMSANGMSQFIWRIFWSYGIFEVGPQTDVDVFVK